MNAPVSHQYIYSRLSEANGFPYHFQHKTGCEGKVLNDSMKKLEKEVQTEASYVQLGTVMFSAIPSIIITLFMGGWSDKVGRRPSLILPTLGSALEAVVILFVMYFKLPIYCLFIGGFLHGICGYMTTIIVACMSYIADTTDKSKIALRLGIIELIVYLGGMVAQLTSGLYIEKLGFIAPYWIIFGCHVAAMLYAIFVVPESRTKPSETGRLFSLDNFKSSWKVYFKASGPRKRNLVILTISTGILSIAVLSINGVISLYTLHSPLCFSPEFVGYFLAFRQFMHGAGGVTAIKAFGMCLSDANVSRIAILSYIGFLVWLGFSKTLLMVFPPIIGIFGGAGATVFRAMMSKIVSADEQGSLFSAVMSVEMLCTFAGTALYNSLYPKSLKFDMPGFVFVLGAFLMLVPFFCTFCLKDQSMFKRKRKAVNSPSGYEKIPDNEEEQEDEQYQPDSPDLSEDSPIVPAGTEEVPKYV
ncbi:hypothetical protein ACROYT_G004499 [Oculina patagonica]